MWALAWADPSRARLLLRRSSLCPLALFSIFSVDSYITDKSPGPAWATRGLIFEGRADAGSQRCVSMGRRQDRVKRQAETRRLVRFQGRITRQVSREKSGAALLNGELFYV